MRQRLGNPLTCCSLALGLLTALLWVRSYWVADSVGDGRTANRPDGSLHYWVIEWSSCQGRIELDYHWHCVAAFAVPYSGGVRPDRVDFGWNANPVSYGRSLTGYLGRLWFYADSWKGNYRESSNAGRTICFPHWLLYAIGSVVPILRLVKRSHGPGLCTNCGYDLRASPTRCPECGQKRESPTQPSPIRSLPSAPLACSRIPPPP